MNAKKNGESKVKGGSEVKGGSKVKGDHSFHFWNAPTTAKPILPCFVSWFRQAVVVHKLRVRPRIMTEV